MRLSTGTPKGINMKDQIFKKANDLAAFVVEDITVDCEKFGIKVRKQLDKRIIFQHGCWATIAFLFQDLEKDGISYGTPKVLLGLFKNPEGAIFKRYSYLIIGSKEKAVKIISLLKEWFNVEDS